MVRSNDAYAWTAHYNVDRTYSANGLNQLTAAGTTSFGYDARGNLTSSGPASYTYSKLNELKTAPGVSLNYDASGRLIEYNPGVLMRFNHIGGMIATEVSGATGAVLRRYVPGPGVDEPVVWYEGAGTTDRRWLQADERGSVLAVSDASGNAIVVNKYDEFGIPQAGNVGRFQYTGQVWLPELGMYYYKARFYSPSMGRFMQTDPIGYGDGLNWYNYVGSDPVNFVDPSGKQKVYCTGSIIPQDSCANVSFLYTIGGYWQHYAPNPNDGDTTDPITGGAQILVTGSWKWISSRDIIFNLSGLPINRNSVCHFAEATEVVADAGTELGLFAATSGALAGFTTGGLHGAATAASGGLSLAVGSGDVSAISQFVADITQAQNRYDVSGAIVRAGINAGGARLVKAAIKPFGFGGWLDKAQQNLRNDTIEKVADSASDLMSWLDPDYGC